MTSGPVGGVRLLGPVVAVSEDGSDLAVGGRRQRTLLALLTVEPGRAWSADELVEQLWAGSPPAGAATTLRSYVSRLRSALGRESVEARSGAYRASMSRELVDAQRFQRLHGQGRDALDRAAHGVASDRLHAALELWRGPALADVVASDVLTQEARRLEELRLVCLEERIEADLALGRQAELVPELELLAHEHPLRERVWRQLVLAHYQCGRQADALSAYRRARELLTSELGVEPGIELRQLEVAVLRQEVTLIAPPALRHNLPHPATSFVGRRHELSQLEALLRDQRLVTLTGLGGAGKTRLGLQLAATQTMAFSGGVWFVELASLTDPALVAGTTARLVAAPEAPNSHDLDRLVRHLGDSEALLVLDNCEHLAAACAELADSVLRACPNVRVLATSRVPLGVAGEHEYAVTPLPVPPEAAPDEELAGSPSVQLFFDRGRAVRRDLGLHGDGLSVVGDICRELDGLPLAIELAAARVKTLALEDIAIRLSDRFRFLRAWKRVAAPRHQTLQATMDWSYDLLREDEQVLLARLSVFAAGFTLEAAGEICTDGDHDRAAGLIERLVDASLVCPELTTATRYRLLETVRQYAADRLAADDVEVVRRRHANYFLDVAEAAHLSIEALGQPQRHELVLPVQDDLRAAIDWATGADVELGLRLVGALENFWVTHDQGEGARRTAALLDRARDVDPILLGQAWRDLGAYHDVADEFDRARAAYTRSGELFRAAGHVSGVATADFRLGVVAHTTGDFRESRRLWDKCLTAFRAEGDLIGELQVLGNLGEWEIAHGDRARGLELIAASIEMARGAGWTWWEAMCLGGLAEAALEDGRAADGQELAARVLSLGVVIQDEKQVVYALAMLAWAAFQRGDLDRAAQLWSTVQAQEPAPGRFWMLDREQYAERLTGVVPTSPISLDEAVEVART